MLLLCPYFLVDFIASFISLVKYESTRILVFHIYILMRNKGNYILMDNSLRKGQHLHLYSCCTFLCYMLYVYCYSSELIYVYKTHHTLKRTKGEKEVIQFIQIVSNGKSDGLFKIFYAFFQGKGMWNFI